MNSIELKQFSDFYQARVKDTGEHVIHRTMQSISPIKDPLSYPYVEETSEKIIGIYLPESKANELILNHAIMADEIVARRRNPVLNDLWHKYQMMLQMYK